MDRELNLWSTHGQDLWFVTTKTNKYPLLNSETSEAYGSTQTGVAFTADTQ